MRFVNVMGKAATRLAVSSALSAMLLGCAAIVPTPAPSLYDLSIAQGVSEVSGSTGSQILITEPKILNALNNDRIVIRPNASQIAFFSDVRWSDRLPRLVQLYLSRAFSETKSARAVGLPGDGLIIDHQLLFDLKAFQIEDKGNAFIARVEIVVRILNDKNGRVIATRTFEAMMPAKDDAVSAVSALNSALDAVAIDLIGWVYQRI